ncbi:MAG: anti-sigma regulatory factor [Acidobacteriota bacterium]
MPVESAETYEIRAQEDVVVVRQAVRRRAVSLGFNLVDQTKIVTAASELARNTFLHGGGGQASVETVMDGNKAGLKLTFMDEGPGIENIDLAMKDGYTSKGGMGLGLGGAKRLSNEFEIESQPGKGTRISIVRWKAF